MDFSIFAWEVQVQTKQLHHSPFTNQIISVSIFSVHLSERPEQCGILSPEICPKPNKKPLARRTRNVDLISMKMHGS